MVNYHAESYNLLMTLCQSLSYLRIDLESRHHNTVQLLIDAGFIPCLGALLHQHTTPIPTPPPIVHHIIPPDGDTTTTYVNHSKHYWTTRRISFHIQSLQVIYHR